MNALDSTNLTSELKDRLRAKLGNRLRNLDVRLSDEGVILSGDAPTYHVKQLAQHGVWEVLPQARLFNAIVVR